MNADRPPCPVCADPIEIEVRVAIRLRWCDAFKLRLAGPELRQALLDDLRLQLTEMALGRGPHPENQ